MPSATLPAVRASLSPFHTLLYDPSAMHPKVAVVGTFRDDIGAGMSAGNKQGSAQKTPEYNPKLLLNKVIILRRCVACPQACTWARCWSRWRTLRAC